MNRPEFDLQRAVTALLAAITTICVAGAVRAASSADSLAGQRATCVDFRSGESFTIGVQHLLADGSIATQWSADGAHLCIGTAKEIASVSVPDGAAGVIVAWVDMRSGEADLYAQRITASGTVAAGWPTDGVALCLAPGFQDHVALTSDGSGGAIATWQDYRSGPNGKIYAQHLTSAGAAAWVQDGIAVSADSSDQAAPAIVADGAGTFVVWQDARSGDYDLRWARLAADGTVTPGVGGAVLVSAPGDERGPRLIGGGAGYVTAIWQQVGPGATSLRAARFDIAAPTALAQGDAGATLAADIGIDPAPAICADAAGGAWVAWSPRPGNLGDIRLQHLTGEAIPAYGDTGLVICAEGHEQYGPALCPDGAGGCIVPCEDDRDAQADIYAQRISAAGVVSWAAGGTPVCLASGEQYEVALRSDGNGGAFATWSDDAVTTRAAFARARPVVSGVLPRLVSVEAGPGRAHLVWKGVGTDATSYAVQRRTESEAWHTLASSRLGQDGALTYEDRTVRPGAQASYRLAVQTKTLLVPLEETPVEIPLPMPLTLRFARTEDRGRTVRISYVLETHERASLELLDVAGRRVLVRELGSPGAGEHEERFASAALPPGIYFARLHQNQLTRTARLALIR